MKINSKEIVSIRIEAELDTLEQIEKIFGSVDTDNSIKLCDGEVELKLLEAGNVLSFNGGLTAELLLSFSVGVASGVVGNLIFKLLCDHVKKLSLNGRRTRITEETITQVIETTKTTVLISKKEIKR